MKRKDIVFLIPEIFLVGSTIYYWVMTAWVFNPIAIALLVILIYQIVFKKPNMGLVVSSLFILLNLYMVLALVSELNEFEGAHKEFIDLVLFGSIFLGLNLLVSTVMLFKYGMKKTDKNKTLAYAGSLKDMPDEAN